MNDMTTEKQNKRPNVPPLRFPEFNDEWQHVKLGSLAIKVGSGSTPRGGNSVYTKAGHCFVRSQNVGMGILFLNDIVYIDERTHQKQKSTEIKENDVLLNITGASIGRTAIATKEIDGGNVNQHVCIIRVRESVVPNFICYYIQLPKTQKYIQSLQTGGSREGLNFDQVRSFPISLPVGIEQSKIVQFLGLLDRRISVQNKIIEDLRQLKSALSTTLFSNINYETIKLGEICSITTGKLDANAMVDNGEYPFFTCAEQVYKIDKYSFDSEALLISGNGANVGYIHYYRGKFNAYQRTYVLSDFKTNIFYIKFYLDKYLHSRIEQEKNTGNTPYILMSTLSEMKIKIPKSEQQNIIIEILSSISNKIEIEQQLIILFNHQKKYLLQAMFI